ncbi:hypothetical protein OSB04_010344 [Centaurea solstitialis]|uniref:Uncharacterized protein n=1 Tax=Centaurea solstitialis TaxID=347529 RepID=A0AA38TJ56_9ASTR|nr:hypothetical protein OSB04_010344 [Centaurea solstitialis]
MEASRNFNARAFGKSREWFERGVWGKIANLNSDIEKLNLSLPDLFHKEMGNGVKTKFWKDVWCANDTLETFFPRLAAVDSDKDCSVAEWIDVSNEGNRMRWNWTRIAF